MKLREAIGLFLALIGGGIVICFAFVSIFYRYAHPKMTETELQLWALERWYAWLPPLVVAFGGYLLFITSRRT